MKILVVDDHPLVREALREQLRQLEPGVQILEAGSRTEALAAGDQNPDLDLVLLDLRLPDAHGFSALTELREKYPAIPVVIVSADFDRATVLAAHDKGASGFIPKTATTAVISSAVRLVLAGGIYLPVSTLAPVGVNSKNSITNAGQRGDSPIRHAADLGLTPRQTQILALLVQGKPNKIISRELGLAESTVKIHITSILKLLNVTNRVQAVIAVGRLGLQLGTTGVVENDAAAE